MSGPKIEWKTATVAILCFTISPKNFTSKSNWLIVHSKTRSNIKQERVAVLRNVIADDNSLNKHTTYNPNTDQHYLQTSSNTHDAMLKT